MMEKERWRRGIGPALAWAAGWAVMAALDGQVGVDQAAITLVFAASLAAVWLPLAASVLVTGLSVLAFDWLFVAPRHSLSVAHPSDVVLLWEVLLLGWLVAGLLEYGRVLARRARRSGQQAVQLRRLGDALREQEDPLARTKVLREALAQSLPGEPALLVVPEGGAYGQDAGASTLIGTPSQDELAAMWHSARTGHPLGPGTGREGAMRALCLPLRGNGRSFGAISIPLSDGRTVENETLAHAQALCDQFGQVLQREATHQAAQAAWEHAQSQDMRNTMLAAISHDYRTPLAAIMSAASSLRDLGPKLSPEQRERLSQTILDETRQLSRLTDNTLQLVRLESPGLQLKRDWESPDELAGAVIARVRKHDPHKRVHVRTEPGLPLIKCDAVLLAQLLENLLDNALKYSDPPAPVELVVRRQGAHIVFAVRDRGPGVAPEWRERIFEVFQRGDWRSASRNSAAQRGAGVGLALCRAIVQAHGGELKLRNRSRGGASFECWLKEEEQAPAMA
jgi:two-component system sensor histidine kinase KdpD